MEWEAAVDRQTAEVQKVLRGVSEWETRRFLHMLHAADKIFLVGRGRTGYIVGTFAMRLMHMGFDVHLIGDCTTPRIREKDLLVAMSGSGVTRMVLHMVQIAQRASAHIVFITYNPAAFTPGKGDLVLHLPARSERKGPARKSPSLHPLGTLFEEALMFYLDLAVWLTMKREGISEEDMAARHTNLE